MRRCKYVAKCEHNEHAIYNNTSRLIHVHFKVTSSRHVIENVNARVKEVFPFFKHTVEGSYVPKIMGFLKICCALINKFYPPLKVNEDYHERVIEKMPDVPKENALKKEIELKNLDKRINANWERADASTVDDFPRISWNQLREVTCGRYQLKIAKRYNDQHLKSDPNYGIFLHKESDGLLRAKIASRFRRSASHHLWIKYTPNQAGIEGLQYYCQCQVGARTFGTCAHITSVIF